MMEPGKLMKRSASAKRPLTPFTGRLSAQHVANGINAAIQNAGRLLADAELLAKSGRFPSACAMAILSIEESGKPSVLRRLAIANDEAAVKALWRDYRSHQAKNAAWIIVALARGGARTLRDLAPIYDPESDHPVILDTIKQLGFYTDSYAAGSWSMPEHVIDEALCAEILLAASTLLSKNTVTVREIELWIEHIGADQSETGLRNYFRAIQAEGFSPPEDEAALERFLGLKGR